MDICAVLKKLSQTTGISGHEAGIRAEAQPMRRLSRFHAMAFRLDRCRRHAAMENGVKLLVELLREAIDL